MILFDLSRLRDVLEEKQARKCQNDGAHNSSQQCFHRDDPGLAILWIFGLIIGQVSLVKSNWYFNLHQTEKHYDAAYKIIGLKI